MSIFRVQKLLCLTNNDCHISLIHFKKRNKSKCQKLDNKNEYNHDTSVSVSDYTTILIDDEDGRHVSDN